MKLRVLLLIIGMLAIVAVAVACGKWTGSERKESQKVNTSQIAGPPYGPETAYTELHVGGEYRIHTETEVIFNSDWFFNCNDYEYMTPAQQQLWDSLEISSARELCDHIVTLVLSEGYVWTEGVGRGGSDDPNVKFMDRFTEIYDAMESGNWE